MEVLKWLHRRRQEGDTTVTEEDILEAARKAGLGDGTTDTGDCGGEGQGEGQDNNGATDIEGGNTDTNGAGTDPNKGGNTDPNAGAGGQGGTGEGGTGMNRTDSDASHSGSESGCSFHAGF